MEGRKIKNGFLPALLVALLISTVLCTPSQSFATSAGSQSSPVLPVPPVFSVPVTQFFAPPAADEPDYTQQPHVIAPRAVLIEADSGTVLFEQSKDARTFPASTAKILTALIAAETLDLTMPVTIDAEAAAAEHGGLFFREGEELSTDALLYAMMLASSNDAAIAVAKAVAGNVGDFVGLMNGRAAKIGAKNTHFVNPNGLHSEDGYTTAYDMALITREAMANENVRRYVGTIDFTIPATNLQKERPIHNGNRLLSNDGGVVSVYGHLHAIYFPEAIGVKTGKTPQAGNCFVGMAQKDGLTLIAAVYGSVDEVGPFMDAIEMFEYGFHNYKQMQILTAGATQGGLPVNHGIEESVNVVVDRTVTAIVPISMTKQDLDIEVEMPEAIEAPVTAGAIVGKVFVYHGGAKLGESELKTYTSVDKKDPLKVFKVTGTAILFVVLSLVAIVVLWIVIAIIRSELRKRNRWKRKYYRSDASTREVKRIKYLK